MYININLKWTNIIYNSENTPLSSLDQREKYPKGKKYENSSLCTAQSGTELPRKYLMHCLALYLPQLYCHWLLWWIILVNVFYSIPPKLYPHQTDGFLSYRVSNLEQKYSTSDSPITLLFFHIEYYIEGGGSSYI